MKIKFKIAVIALIIGVFFMIMFELLQFKSIEEIDVKQIQRVRVFECQTDLDTAGVSQFRNLILLARRCECPYNTKCRNASCTFVFDVNQGEDQVILTLVRTSEGEILLTDNYIHYNFFDEAIANYLLYLFGRCDVK